MSANESSESLKHQVLDVIKDSGAAGVLVEYGEAILDSKLEENVLRDVPVLGSVVSVCRVGLGIRERLFGHKLARMVLQLQDITDQERSEFATLLDQDVKFRDRVLSHLILLVDRLNDIEKATLLGNACRALVLKEISFEQFSRLAEAIDHAHIADLRALASIESESSIQATWAFSFAAIGLLEPAHNDEHGFLQVDVYRLTGLGDLFRRKCLRVIT